MLLLISSILEAWHNPFLIWKVGCDRREAFLKICRQNSDYFVDPLNKQIIQCQLKWSDGDYDILVICFIIMI